jgi:hypothetical protein
VPTADAVIEAVSGLSMFDAGSPLAHRVRGGEAPTDGGVAAASCRAQARWPAETDGGGEQQECGSDEREPRIERDFAIEVADQVRLRQCPRPRGSRSALRV